MKKNLPNIYKGKVKSSNNLRVSYGSNKEVNQEPISVINELFKKNKLYKQDVYIETATNSFNTKIIGRTDKHIITINNEIIHIDSIKNIKLIK